MASVKKADKILKYLKDNPSCTLSEAADATESTSRYVRMLRDKKCPGKSSQARYERIGVLSDVHVPYQEVEAVEKAISKLKERNIDRLVLLGDICDFYSISYFKKDPRRIRFNKEVEKCREWLTWLRCQMFPGIKIDYIEGNHETRLFSYLLDKAPELIGTGNMTVEGLLGLDELERNNVPHQ